MRWLLVLGLLGLAGYLVAQNVPGLRATVTFYLHRGELRDLAASAARGEELMPSDTYLRANVSALRDGVRPGPSNPLSYIELELDADPLAARLVYIPSRDLAECGVCSFQGRVIRDLGDGWYVCEERGG